MAVSPSLRVVPARGREHVVTETLADGGYVLNHRQASLSISSLGPIPECMRILGFSREPAERMTSFEAKSGEPRH